MTLSQDHVPATEPSNADALLAQAERIRSLARWVGDESAAGIMRDLARELEARAVALQAAAAASVPGGMVGDCPQD